MNQKKLNNYKLTASIHTLSIKSNGIIKAQNNTDYIKTFTKFNDNPVSKSKINVNKLMGDVFTYQDFLQKFQEILDSSEIKEYLITRADFRLDSYDKKHYEEYTKLNKYLMILAKEQIRLAFQQAEKEVQDLRQRTKEGIVTAQMNGKQIGQEKGVKLNVKKKPERKQLIKKYSKDFDG